MRMDTGKPEAVRMIPIILFLLIATAAAEEREWEVPGEAGDKSFQFKLKKSELVVKTEGGEIRVFPGRPLARFRSPMHIGFITMEPGTLLLPQYIDANLVIFLRIGEAKIGWIHEDDLVERQLKSGDVLRIPAGATFYLVNMGKSQRLQVICSIDPVETSSFDDRRAPYQSFFIGGGKYPRSVLAGFDVSTLTAAFNATPVEIEALISTRTTGPIVFFTGKAIDSPHRVVRVMRSAMQEVKQRKGLWRDDDENIETDEGERKRVWTWSSIWSSIFLGRDPNCRVAAVENKVRRRSGEPVKAPDAYNLYNRDPDFRNKFGWSIELNEHNYEPLKKSDIGIFLVNLTAGSMMAPHVNPRATEYGVVISGAGTVEVVYPNGTQAMKADVREGDVYWVPRFFPFCQVAGINGPMEIFGFTTSSRRNRPQFLAGASSILMAMMGEELAAGFGFREDELRRVAEAQKESAILPALAAPSEWEKKMK